MRPGWNNVATLALELAIVSISKMSAFSAHVSDTVCKMYACMYMCINCARLPCQHKELEFAWSSG